MGNYNDGTISDVRKNWEDGSMVNIVSSIGRAPTRGDYMFKLSELAPLPFIYYDIFFFQFVPLPVCDLNSLSEKPEHSAILVAWSTPPPLKPDQAVGLYVSKWGNLGIFQHRWGDGYLPPGYMTKNTVRVFAPRPGWNAPYFILHTPWGF